MPVLKPLIAWMAEQRNDRLGRDLRRVWLFEIPNQCPDTHFSALQSRGKNIAGACWSGKTKNHLWNKKDPVAAGMIYLCSSFGIDLLWPAYSQMCLLSLHGLYIVTGLRRSQLMAPSRQSQSPILNKPTEGAGLIVNSSQWRFIQCVPEKRDEVTQYPKSFFRGSSCEGRAHTESSSYTELDSQAMCSHPVYSCHSSQSHLSSCPLQGHLMSH